MIDQVLLHLFDRELCVTPPQRVHEATDGGEGRAELMTRDRDEVGLQLVELAESDEHLLLTGAKTRGLDDQRDLVREAPELQEALAIDRARLVAALVQDPDHGVAGPQRTTASAGSCCRLGRASSGPRRTARCRDEPGVRVGTRVAVDAGRDQLLTTAVAGLEQQDPERVALHLAAHRLGDLLDALGRILRCDAGEDRRVERLEVPPGLGFSPGGFFRLLGRLLGDERPFGRAVGFPAERAGEHPRD